MPVTRICASVDWSTIGRRLLVDGAARLGRSTGPASSTGSPMTFMMRPSVSSPTGTVIGAPVSYDGLAAHETFGRCPWRWCARCSRRGAARLRARGGCRRSSVSSAFRIAGRSPSNCTSTTAPMTCATWPAWPLAPIAVDGLNAALAALPSCAGALSAAAGLWGSCFRHRSCLCSCLRALPRPK